MAFSPSPCPSCGAMLRLADSLSANALVRCPKCDTRFRVPTPSSASGSGVIPSSEPKATAIVSAHSAAIRPAVDAEPVAKIRRSPKSSHTALWIILGVVGGTFLLLLLGTGIAVTVWLMHPSHAPQAMAKPALPPPAVPKPPAMPKPPAADNTTVLFEKGNRCLARGDNDGAITAYSRAIELNPRFAAAYCNRGPAPPTRATSKEASPTPAALSS